jgi:hypothetical protein
MGAVVTATTGAGEASVGASTTGEATTALLLPPTGTVVLETSSGLEAGALVGAPVAEGTTGVVVASSGVGLEPMALTGAGDAALAVVLASVIGGVVVTGTITTGVTMGLGAGTRVVVVVPEFVAGAGEVLVVVGSAGVLVLRGGTRLLIEVL